MLAERAAASGKGKSPRKNSPGRGAGGARTPRPGSKGGKKEAQLSVPTTNDNLAEFEKVTAGLVQGLLWGSCEVEPSI